jgi:glycosyltransferase involved in cell wall biosynthesis
MFVSRLVREKNLTGLAAVLRALYATGVPFRGVIVGEGPEREWLTEQIGEAMACTVFTGALAGVNLSTAYASADIFLFPSPTETFGRVTIEAMASGLPVVAANGGGTMDIVREGIDGHLVDPHDADAYIPPLLRLIRSASERQRMSRNARSRAGAFHWPDILGKMVWEYAAAARGVVRPSMGAFAGGKGADEAEGEEDA